MLHRRQARYRQTLAFFSRVMVRELWWDFFLPRIGLSALSRRTRPARMRGIARSFRELAVRMGGVLIKVGQFLSSRLDVLPREMTEELSGLQDEVGAESFEAIREVVEAELGAPLAERFEDFDPVPLASASIGQVHGARLRRGAPDDPEPAPVVVKVQRPRIEEIIEADLAAIRVAGGWLQRLQSVRKHANVPALIEEFSRALYEEIDYVHEGKNAERFARNFAHRPEIMVPAVLWSHTTRRVLTLQDVGAIKITDYAAMEAAGVDRAAVADMLLDVYLKQVFEDGFFHADPHPGNLFVLPSAGATHAKKWKLVFVDFGMTGTIAKDTFTALREGLLAVGTKDAGRLVRAFDDLRMLLPGADRELLERACARLLETLWGRSTRDMLGMSDRQIRAFSDEFGELLYDMPFQVPENLILLGRCIGILSGMAAGLNPDFSVWKGLSPYIARMMKESGEGGVRALLKEAEAVFKLLIGLPRRADDLAARMQEGKLEVRTPELQRHLARVEAGIRKLAACIVFAGGLVAGTQLFLGGRQLIAALLGAADFILLLWILLAR
jgi:predicted unusual protein kinase regulating ubiquinone biosynthesis (AarF/ABC1/UbiB family)